MWSRLHREEGLVILLAKREQPDDSGMTKILEGIDLGIEPLPYAGVVGEVRSEHLHGDRFAGGRVNRLVHRPHAAAAEPELDLIGAQLGRIHAMSVAVGGANRHGLNTDSGGSCTTAAPRLFR